MSGVAARTWAILRREYVTRVRNKWFLIATFGFPLLMAGAMLFPAWLASGEAGGGEALRVAVASEDPDVRWRLAERLADGDAGIEIDTTRAVPATLSREAYADTLRASGLDGLLILGRVGRAGASARPGDGSEGDSADGSGGVGRSDGSESADGGEGDSADRSTRRARLLVRESLSLRQRTAIRDAVRRVGVERRLDELGVPGSELTSVLLASQVGLDVSRVEETGGVQSQETLTVVAFALTFALYMMFILYGQMIVRGVLEEKTSDIVEILVSSVRPGEMMMGKILGIGGVGLTQVAIWAITLALLGAYALAGGGMILVEAGLDLTGLQLRPVLAVAAAFLVFFVLGYLIYASAFAAVGAVVGDEREAQYANIPVFMLIVIPFILAFSMMQDPTASWILPASLFPFFTPILMLVRVTMGVAAPWEVLLSVFLLILGILGTAWLAGRIYRVGILMKGKRPNLPELWRWLRYG